MQGLTDAPQRVVALEVPIGVVEALELVEVAERDAVRVPVADGAVVVGLEVLVETQPVAEPGEQVGAHLHASPHVQTFELAVKTRRPACGGR